jgi:PadR family transcriptional regulator, regulatory protein PadR
MDVALKGYLDPLILAVLDDAPLHGYAVIEELKARSGGQLDLPEGTVYPALHRLERQRLLVSSWDESSPRRRRLYELTAAGHQALAARRAEFGVFTRGVRGVLRWAAP